MQMYFSHCLQQENDKLFIQTHRKEFLAQVLKVSHIRVFSNTRFSDSQSLCFPRQSLAPNSFEAPTEEGGWSQACSSLSIMGLMFSSLLCHLAVDPDCLAEVSVFFYRVLEYWLIFL
jgi:hypothetical protein